MSEFQRTSNTLDLEALKAILPPMKQDGFVVRGADAKVERIKVPIPGPDECYVKVLDCGRLQHGPGDHEGLHGLRGRRGPRVRGPCESAPHSHQHLVGKRVVGEINLACTTCGVCERGGPRARNHCPKRTVLGILNKNGTYPERLTLPARNLHVVPDSVTTENAAFAEPLAAAFRVVEQNLGARENEDSNCGRRQARAAHWGSPGPARPAEPGRLVPSSTAATYRK